MKLLIAEDEVLAREGIKQLIPSMFDQVLTASNGVEALALARSEEPDVLLCDVRMPKMNGIELATNLRMILPDIHILFISAYSDKEYLKSAISLQADGYIEKPINEAELLDYLTRIGNEIELHQKNEQRQNAMVERYVRQQLLHAILRREDARAEALVLDPALTEIVMGAGRYLPVSIRMQWADNLGAQFGSSADIRLVQRLSDISPDSLCAPLSASQIGLVFYGDRWSGQTSFQRQIEDAVSAIRAEDRHILGIYVCIGEVCSNCNDLYMRYREAHAQVQWMCFANNEPWLCRTLPAHIPPVEDLTGRLSALLEQRKLNEAKQLVCEQTEAIRLGGYGQMEQVRKYYERLLSVCIQADNPSQLNGPIVPGMEQLSIFSRLRTLQELCRFICVRIGDMMPTVAFASSESSVVRDVQDYIRQSLSDPGLSVQAIASHVGLTENYLSAVYKRETGQNLHKVIVEQRMERAKYLLIKRCKMNEVAEKCGFSSVSYFHSAFKKYVGMSPADFAKAHTGKTGK